MYNKTAPFNTVFVLKTSQSYIAELKKALDNRKAVNLDEVQFRLGMIAEALQLGIDRINELTQSQEKAQATFSEGEDLAQELVDELEELAERKTAIRPSEIKTIADELCSTADDLCFLLSSGVNP